MKRTSSIFKAILALLFISFNLAGNAQTATDGDYRSAVTSGNWGTLATWQVRAAGTWATATSLPTTTSNVYIQSGHIITVGANAFCQDFHLNSNTGTGPGAVIVSTGATLQINRKIRNYFAGATAASTGTAVTSGVDGTFYTGQTSTASFTSGITTNGTGKIQFVYGGGNITNSGEWGANITSWNAEFAPSVGGTTGILATSLKAGVINITSGTISMASNDLRPDGGSGGTGTLTVSNGATLRFTSSGNIVRTGTPGAASHCGSVTINGTLEYSGTVGKIDATTVTFAGTVIYSSTTAQTLVSKNSAATGATDPISYTNLTLGGNAAIAKTTVAALTTTVSGKLLMNGNATSTLAIGAGGTLAYGAAATLEYAKGGSTSVGAEWPAVNGPTNINITTNGVSFVASSSTNRTVTGNFTLNGAAFTANTGNSITMANGSTMTKLTANNFNSSGGTYNIGTASTDIINVVIGSGSATPVTIQGSSELQGNGSTLVGSANLTIFSGFTYSMNSPSRTVLNLTLNGTLTDASAGAAGTMTVKGNITGAGSQITSFTTGKILVSGNTTASNISGATFENLELNDADGFTLTGSPTVNNQFALTAGALAVGSNSLTLNGPSTTGTGTLTTTSSSNLVFGGSTAGPVNMPLGISNLNNLTINNTASATINESSSITIAGTLALTSGSLAVGSNTLTLNGPAISGSGSLVTTSASSLAYGGSVAGPFGIPSSVTALNNLTLNNSTAPTFNLNSSITMAGNLAITTGTLAGGTNVLTIGGNITGTGSTYTSSGAGKISMTGASKSVSALTLANIEIASGATISSFGPTITGTFTMGGGNVVINGGNTLTMANNSSIIRTSGNLTLSGGVFAVGTLSTDVMNLTINGNLTSTIEFPGGSSNPGRIALLTINPGITYTLSSSNKGVNNLALNGTLVDDAAILTVRGNITGTGTQTTVTLGTGKILMSGNSVSSSISGATFSNLELNDADGFTSTVSPTVTGTLTLTTGVLQTTTNPIIVTGAVSRTGGWVNGNLRRSIAAGASTVTYNVGDANRYAPLSLTFDASTGGGDLTVNTALNGTAPAAGIAPSGSSISQTKYINRIWNFVNSTVASPLFAATLTYSTSPNDVVGAANTSALIVAQNNAGTWSNPAIASSISPTVTTTTSLTNFGSLYAGETGCIPPSGLAFSNSTIIYCANQIIVPNTASFTGDAATSYSVSPALPAGLTLNTSTGAITGTPTTTAGEAAANYTVTVNNACGSTTVDVNITIAPGAPTGLTYSSNTVSYCANASISVNTPSNAGGAATSYSVSPALPSGLSLNTTTGEISGIPTIVNAAANYTVTATNSCGSTTADVNITVTPGAPTSLSYTSNSIAYCINVAISTNTPSNAGGAAISYSVSPALPTGLSLNTTTGSITGLPTVATAAANYVVTASNTCGSTTATLNIAVSTNTFTGTGNYTNAGNWSCGFVPAPSDAIVIGAGANATLNTNLNVTGSLTITASGTLTVAPTNELSVAVGGTVNFNNQSVTLQSTASGTAAMGKVLGTLSGATNVTVERFIPANALRAWRLLAVPTKGSQTIKQSWQEGQPQLANGTPGYGTIITSNISSSAALLGAGFDAFTTSPSMQSYGTGAWVNVTNTNVAIESDKAYFLYIRGSRAITPSVSTSAVDATTLRTTGTLYQGSVTVNTAGSFTPIANVYASAINFTGLTRSGVSNTYYLWDAKKASGAVLGAYQTFSGTNGFQCIPGGGSFTQNQVNTTIQSGQGFFVSGVGTVTFNESAKVSGSSLAGYRPATPVSALVKIDSRLYNSSNTLVDANVVVFNNNYANTVDADDAVKYTNPAENFGIVTNNTKLAVEGRKPITEDDVINFNVSNLKEQTYTLEFTAANMSNSNLEAQLVDKYLGTYTPVDITGVTKVNITVNADAGSKAADRFSLVFKVKPSQPAITKASIVVSPNPVEGSSMNLQFANQAAGKYTVRILNLQGKAITTAIVNHAGGSSNQVISLSNKVAAGMYKVEVIGADKTRTVQTVFVQ